MPIEYRIDHSRKLVVALGHGIFSDPDVFGYQNEVWSRPDVAGYNQLIDMTAVEQIALPSVGRIRQLAALAAKMDDPAFKTKFAIVAPQNIAYGLGRMFAIFRRMDPRSRMAVGVFRTLPEAFEFLGIQDDPPEVKV